MLTRFLKLTELEKHFPHSLMRIGQIMLGLGVGRIGRREAMGDLEGLLIDLARGGQRAGGGGGFPLTPALSPQTERGRKRRVGPDAK